MYVPSLVKNPLKDVDSRVFTRMLCGKNLTPWPFGVFGIDMKSWYKLISYLKQICYDCKTLITLNYDANITGDDRQEDYKGKVLDNTIRFIWKVQWHYSLIKLSACWNLYIFLTIHLQFLDRKKKKFLELSVIFT